MEEEQTIQWPKEKVQKNKQRSTKHTHKTRDRVTRTPLKTVPRRITGFRFENVQLLYFALPLSYAWLVFFGF